MQMASSTLDRFIIKTVRKGGPSKPLSNCHVAVNIDANERARKYPKGTFHIDDGRMFCSSCNVVVDHIRKSVVDKHLEAVSHKKLLGKQDGLKQKTLKTLLNCKTTSQVEKVAVCQEWVTVCTAANIPLHKSDNFMMRNFLRTRVLNGGAIPKSSQLRDYYIFDVYQASRAELKEKLKNKKVALIVDELSDNEGRYVFDVLAVCLDFDELSPKGNTIAYLLDTHFLTATNNRTVSQAVVKTVHEYAIGYNDVRIFNSDNVAYMKKAFVETLSCLFPLCIHITCHSHIVNLVASDFKKSFKEVTEFVKCFRNLFFVPSGRKSRFLNHMQRVLGQSATMPPNPTTKSWSAWFDSVLYHAEYYHLGEDFIQEEIDRAPSTASNSLLRLEEIYKDPSFMKKLHAQLSFLRKKAPTLMIFLKYFQERMPHVTQAHVKMASLLNYLEVNTKLVEQDLAFCFEGAFKFSSQERQELVSLFISAFTSAHAKLSKYVVNGAQPATEFLDEVRVLDPRNLVDMDKDFNSMNNIPGIETVPRHEWPLYVNKLGPLAVKNSKDGKVDLRLFWKSKASDLPQLYNLASIYCTTTIGSYDVERSFSAYSEILDEKRRSLDESTLKAFHFLNWNLQLKCTVEKEKESLDEVTKVKVTKVKAKQVPPFEAKEFPRLWNLKRKSDATGCTYSTEGQLDQRMKEEAKRKINDDDTQSLPEKVQKKDSGKLYGEPSLRNKPTHQPPQLHSNLFSATCEQPLNSPEPHLYVQYGLPQNTAALLNKSTTCVLPAHKQPLLNALLDDAVSFRGPKKIDIKDLSRLWCIHGCKQGDEDKFLTNFVIEAYFDLISTSGISKAVQVESLLWEIFEKGIGRKPAQQLLKGKYHLMEQDLVLVPCNPDHSRHWFLLAVLPKQKEMFILDSLAGASTKPAAHNAIKKMWRLLQEFDNSLEANQWKFYSNTPEDIPQQQNGYDCGVYACLFARCLVLHTAIPAKGSIHMFRQQMILELQEKELQSFAQPSIREEHYYAVEYLKSYYFGRALNTCEPGGGFVNFKFLHSTGAQVFNWPRRDDMDCVHSSCVFYGPVKIMGVGPFTISQENEVQNVYNWLKKSRKNQ